MHSGIFFRRGHGWLLWAVWGTCTLTSNPVSATPADSAWVTAIQRIEHPADLPFRETLQEYYALFPGMVLQNYRGTDYLHYRGSRHDEIGYTLEGADIRSAFTGQVALHLIPEALEDITLRSSPTAAEGSAPVVLQHTLRTGREGFHLSLRGESDRFTPAYTSRWGTFSYGYENMVGTVEGSLLSGGVRFFLGVEARSLSDAVRVFWDGFTIGGPGNPLTIREYVYIPPEAMGLEPQGYEKIVPGAGWVGNIRYAPSRSYGYSETFSYPLEDELGTDRLDMRPGNIPENALNQLNLNGTVTVMLDNWRLRGIAASTRDSRQINEQPIANMFRLDRVPVQEDQTDFLALKASYAWSPTLTANVTAYGFDHSSRTYDPRYGDNFLFDADTLVSEDINANLRLDIHGFDFYQPDTEILRRYTKSDERILGFRAGIDKIWTRQQLSAGFEFQRGTIRYYKADMNILRRTFDYLYAQGESVDIQSLTDAQLRHIRYSIDEAYGYDLLGQSIERSDDFVDGPRHPVIFAGYAAYQRELDHLILRAGLRLEGVSTGAQVFSDPTNPPGSYWGFTNIPIESLKDASATWTLLPRISLSSRITSRLSMAVSYTAHATLPQLQNIYASRNYRIRILSGEYFITDMRGWDAEPVKSDHITWNVTYQPMQWLALMGQVYYSYYWRLLDARTVTVDPNSAWWHYPILANKGVTMAQGIETTVLFQPSRQLQVTWNHTISSVKGTASFPNWNAGLTNYDFFRLNPALPLRPLNYDQANQGNIHLSYRTPPTAPIFLRNLTAQVMYRYNSGHYTDIFPDATSG
ncbi:MAG: TonB-dependent receptor [Fidelibacterota bacterium]|nr:MAG: TonB-dependent receptor [Candidatus Neomarinimicrobiota bacterium]